VADGIQSQDIVHSPKVFYHAVSEAVTMEAHIQSLAIPCRTFGGQSSTGTGFSLITLVFLL